MSLDIDDCAELEEAICDDVFWHIEASLNNGFEVGMRLEIEHRDNCYWIASVVGVFDQLLSLKWDGTVDTFWFDLKNKCNKCYSFGFFRGDERHKLEPPNCIHISQQSFDDIKNNYLQSIDSSSNNEPSKPQSLFNLGGISPVDLFSAGTVVEVSHQYDPEKHWFAEIVRNIGGRLQLKWICRDDNQKSTAFWLFLSHPRVYYLGFAKEKGNISYEPPFLYESWASDIQRYLTVEPMDESYLRKYLLNAAKTKRPSLFDSVCFANMKVNDKVLTFDSASLSLVPATVKNKIANDYCIITQRNKDTTHCYPNEDSFVVLPFFWGTEHDIKFHFDGDYAANCDRNQCLQKFGGRAAPLTLTANSKINEFKVNAKLEVVHPNDPDKICEGRIHRVTFPLVWIQISSDKTRVLPYNSTEMFPSGWAKNNDYPLMKLLSSFFANQNNETPNNELKGAKTGNSTLHPSIPGSVLPNGSKAWCPRIFFNHKCFTGPALSKSKICELPRSVGPGPVQLVIQEVVSKIISVAYVPSRVLNELSSKAFDDLVKKNRIKKTISVEFKAKYQKRCYRDRITVIRSSEQVEEYCRTVCSHLKCCYNLFGTQLYDGDDCPSNCRGLTKSNKVLKRAIYYREKAVEAKQNQPSDEKVRKMSLLPRSNDNDNGQNQIISTKKSGNESHASDGESNGTYKTESCSSQLTVDSKMEVDESPKSEKTESKKENIDESGKRTSSSNDSAQKDSTNDEPATADETRKSLVIKPKKSKGSKCDEESVEHFDNPLHWSVKDVYNVIKKSHCSVFANTLLEHEIDGAALLLLDNETIRTNLLTGYTRRYSAQEVVKLSTLIQRLKSKWYRSIGRTQCLR